MSSRAMRQLMLDTLNANNGDMTAHDIVTALLPRVVLIDTVSRVLSSMATSGECTRRVGKTLRGLPFVYCAVVTEAFDDKKIGRPASRATKPKSQNTVGNGILGVYVHDNSQSKPNHGGQGAISAGPRRCIAMLGE